MGKRMLLVFVSLFLAAALAWGGRCGPPPRQYDPQKDSYIVIEGTIFGLPNSYYKAYPAIIGNPFNPPSGCGFTRTYEEQTPNKPYYCWYFIFKDTSTKPTCWEYFRNITSAAFRVSRIVIRIDPSSGEELWGVDPSSRMIILSGIKH